MARLEGRRHISHTVLTEIWYDNKTGNIHNADVTMRRVHITIHAFEKQ